MPTSARSDRRQEILERLGPSVEEMLRSGATYSDVSVKRLIQDAGTSRSRFYVYFEDKGDVLRALTAGVVADLADATIQWWSLPSDGTIDDLRELVERTFSIYLDHRHLMAAVAQVSTHDSAVREHFTAHFNAGLEDYAEQIETGQHERRLDSSLDPFRTAQLLSSMTESGLYELSAAADDAGLNDEIDALTLIVWNTLYAPTRCGDRDA